jgi:8-oxo-dGTP diphosphatase
MTDPRLFVAFKAFIERDGKILVVRESGSYKDSSQKGKWGIPGGRLEPGERYDDGLKREVKEETGLDIEFGRPFHVAEWRPVVRGEPWHVVAVFVRCESPSGEVVLSNDHEAFEWIDPAKHADYPIIESEHAAFEAYLSDKN